MRSPWRSQRMVRVSDEDGAILSASEIPASGVLFLVSGSLDAEGGWGLSLSEEPPEPSLLYALFLRRGRRLVGVGLRAEVVLPRGRVSRLQDQDLLVVGTRRLRLTWGRAQGEGRPPRSRRRLAMFAILLLLAGGMALLSMPSLHRPAAKPSAPPEEHVLPAPRATGEADLLAEARGALRAGRREQARLALLQALERAPGDREAQALLSAIDGAPPSSVAADGTADPPASAEGVDALAQAQARWEEGGRLLRAGDARGALERFDAAAVLLRGLRAPASFGAALGEARSTARESLRRETAPRLSAARARAQAARGKGAAEAVADLAAALEEIAAAGPGADDAEVETVKHEIRAALASAAERWLAAAQTAERLKGCTAAAPLYRQIALALASREEDVAARAEHAAARCGGEEERPRGGGA